MAPKSSLKAFREKIARIQDELRERIENECTGFDNICLHTTELSGIVILRLTADIS